MRQTSNHVLYFVAMMLILILCSQFCSSCSNDDSNITAVKVTLYLMYIDGNRPNDVKSFYLDATQLEQFIRLFSLRKTEVIIPDKNEMVSKCVPSGYFEIFCSNEIMGVYIFSEYETILTGRNLRSGNPERLKMPDRQLYNLFMETIKTNGYAGLKYFGEYRPELIK